MDSCGSRPNSENPLCVYFHPKRNSKNSKRIAGTRNNVKRAYYGDEGLDSPEDADYSRSNKALKPPKVNEYRLEKPQMKKSDRQNVFIDSYYPVVSGDLSEDCEGSKKSQNLGKDSVEDLPRKNIEVKFTRKFSEFERGENPAISKFAKSFPDKRKQRKFFMEWSHEPEKLHKKPKTGILKGEFRKVLEPPLQRNISEITFDCKTYTVNSCMSDKDVSFDVSAPLDMTPIKCGCAQQQKAYLDEEPVCENKMKNQNNPNVRQVISNVPLSLETASEGCECNQRQRTSTVHRHVEEPTSVCHRKSANENITKIVENVNSKNCNSCEALSAIDCFAQLYKRIETLEELLQKSLARKMAIKKMKNKPKSREANSPDNCEVNFDSKVSPSGVWFLDTPSASELSTFKGKNVESEDSDTDSELQKIKKRLKVLERKLRALSSSYNTFLFGDDIIRGRVKDGELTKPRLLDQIPGKELYIVSKEKKDGDRSCGGDFAAEKSSKKDKVKSLVPKHKMLKKKCSSVVSSSRKSSWSNSGPLSISNEILYQRSVITKKSMDRTVCCYTFTPKVDIDEDEEDKLTKVVFVRQFKQKRQEPDLKNRKKKVITKRKRRKDLCKKNSETNISLLWYRPKLLEKSDQEISPSIKSVTFGDYEKSPVTSDFGDLEKKQSFNSLALGDHGKSPTKQILSSVDDEKSQSSSYFDFGDNENSQTAESFSCGNLEKKPVRKSSAFGKPGKSEETNRNSERNQKKNLKSSGSIRQVPLELSVENGPGTQDIRCKSKLATYKLESRGAGSSFDTNLRAPCSFFVPLYQRYAIKRRDVPEDVNQNQEQNSACNPPAGWNALQVLKNGGNIRIPVLLTKTNNKLEKRGMNLKGTNMSMKLFVVEGDIKNPRATLKRLIKELSRERSSSGEPEQFIFGMMNKC